jgi:hypothetical protein
VRIKTFSINTTTSRQIGYTKSRLGKGLAFIAFTGMFEVSLIEQTLTSSQ